MTRIWSTEAEPHRVLGVYDDPQQGEDVRALQVAAKKRLSAKGIKRDLKIDGIFGPTTAAVFDTTIWALGALQSTIDADELSIGAQRLIRYPGTRNKDQLQRARDRGEALRKEHEAKHVATSPTHGPSNLTDAQRSKARENSLEAFELAFKHAGQVHYTQGPLRWQGISNGLRSNHGEYPNYADCSSMFEWTEWNGLTSVGGMDFPDILSGQDWTGGYTGSLLLHGLHVDFDALQLGDAIIYGDAWPGHHVAEFAGYEAGVPMVYSHGSEPGPFHLKMRYRTDLLAARRYI